MAVTPPPAPPPAGMNNVGNNLTPGLTRLGEVVVEEVPARLAAVTRTILLSGLIAEQLKTGAVVLKTQAGEVTIRSPQPLPEGKLLTLQIPPGAPPVRAEVFISTSVTPAPPPPARPAASPTLTTPPPTSLASPLPPSITTSSTPALPPLPAWPPVAKALPLLPLDLTTNFALPPPMVGMVLRASIQALPEAWATPATTAPPRPSPPNPQLQGALQQVRTIPQPVAMLKVDALAELLRQLPANVFLPEPNNAPSPTPPPTLLPASAAAAKPAAPVPAPVPAPALLNLPPGSRVWLLVEAVTDPLAPSPTPAVTAATSPTSKAAPVTPVTPVTTPPIPLPDSPAPGRPEGRTPLTFPATPVGQTPAGETLLTSPAGLLIMPEKLALTPKTILTVSVLEIEEPPIDAEPTPLATRHWPALQEAVNLLPQSLPPRLPKPGPAMLPLLLLFMGALKLNDTNSWLGEETLRALREAGGENLISRLSAEFQAARSPENAPPDNWKTLALPLPPDGQLSHLVLHTRREADPATPGEFGQRLLVEVELSRLGPMQFDGFIRAKRFDLTLRSQKTLPAEIRSGTKETFLNALNAVGYHGGLKFETAADIWLNR